MKPYRRLFTILFTLFIIFTPPPPPPRLWQIAATALQMVR